MLVGALNWLIKLILEVNITDLNYYAISEIIDLLFFSVKFS